MPPSSAPAPDPDGRPDRLFVYGTLRPGRVNWPVAEPFCARYEPATLPGYGLYALDHPVVARVEAHGVEEGAPAGVRGDLLHLRASVTDLALDRLDGFEGVDHGEPGRSYYRRIRTVVVTDDGAHRSAWLYVPGDELRSMVDESARVPGDDWP